MSPFPREAYRPLVPYAPDRRPIEVDLSDNTNRWGTHPAAMEQIRRAPVDALTRYPSVYADALRNAVATRFNVPIESVATGCGSDDLLDSTFRAAGEPGERVAFATPTFSMVETFARMNGMEPVALPWLPGAPPEPEALLESGPALVYVCRPNNPTGEVVPRRWVERLLEAGGNDGPVVLLDEAYADFHGEDFLAIAPGTSRLLVVRTLSKSYGLAGLRVAFAVGAPEVIRQVEISRGPYKVNHLAERAAVAALEDREGWVPRIIEEVRRNREWLERQVAERGYRPLPSGANFILLPVADAGATVAALRERGVAVRPFPTLPGLGDGIRVSIGPMNELERFLQALDDLQVPPPAPVSAESR